MKSRGFSYIFREKKIIFRGRDVIVTFWSTNQLRLRLPPKNQSIAIGDWPKNNRQSIGDWAINYQLIGCQLLILKIYYTFVLKYIFF